MLHEHAGRSALRAFRALVFGLWFVTVLRAPIDLLAELPRSMFEPHGILRLLPTAFWDVFITAPVLLTFRFGLAALLLAVAVARRPPTPLLLLASAGVLLFHGFAGGYGTYVDHARFVLLYLTLLLSLASIGMCRDEGSRARATLRLSSLILAAVYALIGWQRIFVGGWEIFTNDALPTYMLLRTFEPGAFDFQLSYRLLGIPALIPVLGAAFLATTAAEALSPLAVFHARFRAVWLAVIVPFHFVTLLTMNIFFWQNLVLILFLFTELPARVERRSHPAGGALPRPAEPLPDAPR